MNNIKVTKSTPRLLRHHHTVTYSPNSKVNWLFEVSCKLDSAAALPLPGRDVGRWGSGATFGHSKSRLQSCCSIKSQIRRTAHRITVLQPIITGKHTELETIKVFITLVCPSPPPLLWAPHNAVPPLPVASTSDAVSAGGVCWRPKWSGGVDETHINRKQVDKMKTCTSKTFQSLL